MSLRATVTPRLDGLLSTNSQSGRQGKVLSWSEERHRFNVDVQGEGTVLLKTANMQSLENNPF